MFAIMFGLALVSGSQGLSGMFGEAASSPVTTQPLAAGEVLLEVNAIGRVVTRADRATLRVNLSVTGATEAAAAEAKRLALQRVRAAARAAGAREVEFQAGEIRAVPVVPGMMGEAMPAEPNERVTGGALLVFELRDIARATGLRDAVTAQDGVGSASLTYALADDAAAASNARRLAVSSARAEADDYAAAMTMRVIRVVRVTERVGIDILGMMTGMAGIEREFEGLGNRNSPDITTLVSIGVDYALAPR